jgi:hypothetical protein
MHCANHQQAYPVQVSLLQHYPWRAAAWSSLQELQPRQIAHPKWHIVQLADALCGGKTDIR